MTHLVLGTIERVDDFAGGCSRFDAAMSVGHRDARVIDLWNGQAYRLDDRRQDLVDIARFAQAASDLLQGLSHRVVEHDDSRFARTTSRS